MDESGDAVAEAALTKRVIPGASIHVCDGVGAYSSRRGRLREIWAGSGLHSFHPFRLSRSLMSAPVSAPSVPAVAGANKAFNDKVQFYVMSD